MTHDELLESLQDWGNTPRIKALRAVVELHRPQEIKLLSGEVADTYCYECEQLIDYPCPTIQAIEKELA